MVASYIKILKSCANFINNVRGNYESPRYLDKQCAAGDVVSSTRKIRIRGSKFKFFVSIFRKFEEIINSEIINRKSRIVVTIQPLKIAIFFLPTISHTCGAIKPTRGAAII